MYGAYACPWFSMVINVILTDKLDMLCLGKVIGNEERAGAIITCQSFLCKLYIIFLLYWPTAFLRVR